ncbi:MAG: TolC family protein [Actinomycetota bacterium]
MRVFRHLMVVGVGAAITFSNVGRSASALPPTQPQDNPAESNQLQFGPDFKSAPQTAKERKSQEGYVPALSPPTEAEADPNATHQLSGPEFKSAAKTVNGSSQQEPSLTPPQEASETQPVPLEWKLTPAHKLIVQTSSEPGSSPTQAQQHLSETQELNFKSATQKKASEDKVVNSASVATPDRDPQPVNAEFRSTFSSEVRENQKSTQKSGSVAFTPEAQATVLPPQPPTPEEAASGSSPQASAETKSVNRLSELAQTAGSTSAPLQSFPKLSPNGTESTNPPSYLEPSPNPLQFPTQPSEVRVQGIQPITLQQALDLARRGSQTIQIAELQLQQSRSLLAEQRAALFPSLVLQTDLSHSLSASGELSARAQERQARSQGISTNVPNYSNSALSTNLELSYDVDLFGRTAANIQAAKEQVRVRELEVERLVEQLRFDITSAYYNLQDADGRVAIGQAAVRNAQKSLQDAEALERAGVGTRFAVLQAQVNLANEQQRLNEAIRDQRVGRRTLTQLLNVNPAVELTAADPVEQAGVWGRTLEDSIVLAFKNRAELEQQLVQRDLSRQEREAALRGLYPQLRLAASYNLLGSAPGDPGRFVPRGWADGYTVRATLSWNLFDGGAAQARAQQREADIQLAESRFDQLRSQIRQQVEQAYFELESSFASIETAEAGVEQAREALRLARLRFQAGVGTQTDVIQAETDLTRAERNRLLAIIGYNRALSSLQRAVSNLPNSSLSDTP